MRIDCPHCHNALNVVPDSSVTQSVTCPSCGSRLPQFETTAPYRGELLERIGRFELLEIVGQGQFGTVWKARDTRIGRVVALKLPRREEIDDNTKGLFLREARASAAVQHPNIVTVLDVDEIDGQIFIASEFINGVTLRDKLSLGRMNYRRTAQLLTAVAEGIHKAHDAGITHRDLKPSNILVDIEDKPYVSDFGLAKQNAGEITLTVAGMVLGTPAYMSPEQARGDSHVADRRSDVYSLGVILYQMLTGKKPFEGDSSLLLHQIQSKDPRTPRSLEKTIPRDLETICLKAMEKAPDRRYQTAGEFAADLQRYLNGDSIHARPTSSLERGYRKAKRNPGLVVAMVIAAVSVCVSVLLLTTRLLPSGTEQTTAEKTTTDNEASTATPVSVNLNTEPEGAELHIFPRDAETGEPQYDKGIRAASRTPTTVELPAGRYLIFAVLEDGGFHEVFRRVPDNLGDLPQWYPHERWKILEDGQSIELPKIVIPESDPAQNMVLVPGHPAFIAGAPALPMLPQHQVEIRDFFLDPTEVTYTEFLELAPEPLKQSRSVHPEGAPPDFPVTRILVHDAIAYAERIGKRLPTEYEYEFAATRGGTRKLADDTLYSEASNWEIRSVRGHDYDRISYSSDIHGLFSNASELTSSWFVGYFANTQLPASLRGTADAEFALRGGPAEAPSSNVDLTLLNKNGARFRVLHHYRNLSDQISFRCARSRQPVLVPDVVD